MIEQTVDVRRAARCAIYLGNVKIFIEADAQWYAGESENLRHGDLHDDDIHKSQTVELPVFAVGLNKFADVFFLLECFGEEG